MKHRAISMCTVVFILFLTSCGGFTPPASPSGTDSNYVNPPTQAPAAPLAFPSPVASGSVSFTPTFAPITITIDTNGEIRIALSKTIPTPIGDFTFDLGAQDNFSTFVDQHEKNYILVRVDNHIQGYQLLDGPKYELTASNISIDAKYAFKSLRLPNGDAANYWVLELESISPANVPPQLLGPISTYPITLRAGENKTVSLLEFFRDPDGSPYQLAFQATSQSPTNSDVTVDVRNGGILTIDTSTKSFGTHLITVTATDPIGAAISTSFTIDVQSWANVKNNLIYPIKVRVGDLTYNQEAGETKTYDLPNGADHTLIDWVYNASVIKGTVLGESPLAESIPVGAGETLNITNKIGTTYYYVPVITNMSNMFCSVGVNISETVPAGSAPGWGLDAGKTYDFGYYMLSPESTIDIICNGQKWHYPYSLFANNINPGTGKVIIHVNP